MKHVEEDYAKDLYSDLLSRFSQTEPETIVLVEGAGVHWRCTAKRGADVGSVACFNSRGPEYLTSFRRDSKEIAMGRTSSKSDTINAIEDWLSGQQLSQLYVRFAFVDGEKRALESIRTKLLQLAPTLASVVKGELKHVMCDLYELWLRAADRSCKISFWGRNEFPDAMFHWDDCELFRFRANDQGFLAAITKRWLADRAMPSVLRVEFPSIEIGKLADYYEEGNGVEGEFVMSWDSIEEFYKRFALPFIPLVHRFIAELRERGYDRYLRAGQSMILMVLSRSRRHGMRDDQPSITFRFRDDGMVMFVNDSERHFPAIAVTPEIVAALDELKSAPVD